VAHQAWNNFVLLSEPAQHAPGSERRAAAIACRYLSLSNNGGLNSFLTCSNDLDAEEVLASLIAVGAPVAADQFKAILRSIAEPLPAASQADRWAVLDRCWTEDMDRLDVLSEEADTELKHALERHVGRNAQFYVSLAGG
jgi:hypothetical protein